MVLNILQDSQQTLDLLWLYWRHILRLVTVARIASMCIAISRCRSLPYPTIAASELVPFLLIGFETSTLTLEMARLATIMAFTFLLLDILAIT